MNRATKLCRNVSANVRRLATARRLTLHQVADFAGIGRATLVRLLDKQPSNPRLSTVEAVARVLAVGVAELLQTPPERLERTGRSDPGDLRLNAANNVRRLAAARGVAIAHLADRAGIGRTTLWRILDAHGTGASDPRLRTIVRLATYLKVTTVEFLSEAPAEEVGR